ncbi:MAG: hypothetical protein NZ951_03835 [Dehalococcoidia bacterium]|nr:hypothetical protein [Dehalococcoidia bacterium]MDW8120271.1 hypothetical protein [Chloroflexota bacterium]
MTTPHRLMGINDFVEELARTLLRAPLRDRYSDHEEFKSHLKALMETFLKDSLASAQTPYAVWSGVAEPGAHGIVPTRAFGQTYIPDLVVDIAGRPTLAFLGRFLGNRRTAGDHLAEALGKALVLSAAYPAVFLFCYAPDGAVHPSGLMDREILLDLWSRHKVRVVLR